MPTLAVATDFSTRSDRALRRATLLAKRHDADLLLVHAIDDDQPARLVEVLHAEARALLDDLEATISAVDGIACRSQIRMGEPFEQVPAAAVESDARLLIMGPHRRQVLRDQFRGTTVERTIRRSKVPVLVANAVPAAGYDRVLLTTVLDEDSVEPMRQALGMKMLEGSEFILVHVYDALGADMLGRSLADSEARLIQDQEAQEKASAQLHAFAERTGLSAARTVARRHQGRVEGDLLRIGREEGASLIAVSTGKKGLFETLLLGSVAEGVLRDAEQDILVMPQLEAV